MFLHLNIDVWKDRQSKDIYVNGDPDGVETELIKAGTPIEHSDGGSFMRRIKDEKIIFGPSCLPEIDRSSYSWKWEGLAARKVLKRAK